MNKQQQIEKQLMEYASASTRTQCRIVAAIGKTLKKRLDLLRPYVGRDFGLIPLAIVDRCDRPYKQGCPAAGSVAFPEWFCVPEALQPACRCKYLSLSTLQDLEFGFELTDTTNNIYYDWGIDKITLRDWSKLMAVAEALMKWSESPWWGSKRAAQRKLRMAAKAAKAAVK